MATKNQKANALKFTIKIIEAYASSAGAKNLPATIDGVYKKLVELIEVVEGKE